MVAELVEATILLNKWHFDRLNARLQEHFGQPPCLLAGRNANHRSSASHDLKQSFKQSVPKQSLGTRSKSSLVEIIRTEIVEQNS